MGLLLVWSPSHQQQAMYVHCPGFLWRPQTDHLKVPVWSATVFGVAAAFAGEVVKKVTDPFLKEDKLDVFAIHAGGGALGMFLTALFAE
jgi:Ammonium Transporter Family